VCNEIAPYQRGIDRRDFLKKTGGFLGTVFGMWAGYQTIDALIPDRVEAGDAFASQGEYKEATTEELGLRFEYSPCRRNAIHRKKKSRGDEYFWDVQIVNQSDKSFKIEKMVLDSPHSDKEILSGIISKAWGTNTIQARGKLFQPDRSLLTFGGASWPAVMKDIYFLRDNIGNQYKVISQRLVP